VSPVQPENALSPIVVSPSGIVMLVSFGLCCEEKPVRPTTGPE